jgi:hypothetical protein
MDFMIILFICLLFKDTHERNNTKKKEDLALTIGNADDKMRKTNDTIIQREMRFKILSSLITW